MPIASYLTFPTGIVAVILTILLAFIIWPGLAKNAGVGLRVGREKIFAFIRGVTRVLGNVWNLEGKQHEAERRRAELLQRQITNKRKRLGKEIAARARAAAQAKGAPLTAQEFSELSDQVTMEYERVHGEIGKTKLEVINAVVTAAKAENPALTPDQLTAISNAAAQEFELMHGQIDPPTTPQKVSAWGARMLYLALAVVCLASDFVFTAARLIPILGGGTFDPPPLLRGLFSQLALITGVLFVSIAILGGMLALDEYLGGTSDYIKLRPYIPTWFRWTGFALSVVMLVTGFTSVLGLVFISELIANSESYPIAYQLVVFAGIAAIIFVGVALSFPGLLDAAQFIAVVIVFLLAVTIGFALWLLLLLLEAFVTVLAAINIALVAFWKALRGTPDALATAVDQIWALISRTGGTTLPSRSKAGLAIVGYGAGGSAWAVAICREYATLFGMGRRTIRWAGTDSKGSVKDVERRQAIHLVAATDISVRNHDITGLINQLKTAYSATDIQNDTKPLLWIAQDDDLEDCLDKLKALQNNENFTGVKLVILWVLTAETAWQKNIRQLAASLQTWASEPGTPLMTTLVIEQDSPFARTFTQQHEHVAQRSVATLLGAGLYNDGQAFEAVASNLHKNGYRFSYLSTGSRGIFAQGAPETPTSRGTGGKLDPSSVAAVLRSLSTSAFDDQSLSTIQQEALTKPIDNQSPKFDERLAWWRQQQRSANIYVVVPPETRLTGQPNTFATGVAETISAWLTPRFGIAAGRVSVMVTSSRDDTGVDISAVLPEWKGTYYVHFTALRGVVDARGVTAMPRELQLAPATQAQDDSAQIPLPAPSVVNSRPDI